MASQLRSWHSFVGGWSLPNPRFFSLEAQSFLSSLSFHVSGLCYSPGSSDLNLIFRRYIHSARGKVILVAHLPVSFLWFFCGRLQFCTIPALTPSIWNHIPYPSDQHPTSFPCSLFKALTSHVCYLWCSILATFPPDPNEAVIVTSGRGRHVRAQSPGQRGRRSNQHQRAGS